VDLEQAKSLYVEALIKNPSKGALCPCCLRKGGARRRNINPDQAVMLFHFYMEYGQNWGSLKDLRVKHPACQSREEAKLRFWKVFEPMDEKVRAKYWRVTDLGVAWMLEETHVPRWVYVLNNEVIKHAGGDLWFRDALSPKYEYDLLAATT
jgi:hypothetical protein